MHPACNKKLKKCVIVLHSTAPLTTKHEYVSTHILLISRMYSSSTFYAQNPALEIVDQQKSVNAYLHINVRRKCSAEEPLMRSSILYH